MQINFHPLEVVDRDSETQLQAGEYVIPPAPRATSHDRGVVVGCVTGRLRWRFWARRRSGPLWCGTAHLSPAASPSRWRCPSLTTPPASHTFWSWGTEEATNWRYKGEGNCPLGSKRSTLPPKGSRFDRLVPRDDCYIQCTRYYIAWKAFFLYSQVLLCVFFF